MLALDLTQAERQALEASFKPDKFRGLRGPLSIPADWIREMERIDARLVLRWQPNWRLYAVFMRMDATGKLFSQPVHIIQTPEGRCRAPDSRDLFMIRKANWLARERGALAWVEHMDKTIAADARHAQECQARVLDDGFDRLCRRGNLTVGSLGRTRKAFNSGRTRTEVKPCRSSSAR